MPEIKTKATENSVKDFIEAVPNEQMQADSWVLVKLMQKITGEPPKLWGPSIIGFGSYHYIYDSGHEGDMCLVGFSPRKAAISLYVFAGSAEDNAELLEKLGKHTTGKSCLYVKKLSDIDLKVLEQLIHKGVKYAKSQHKEKV